jgi:hypothetical protein
MTEATSTYARAVALFSALVERPSRSLCLKPANVLAGTGRATATGYRALAEAEATGLLSRDSQQAYVSGPLARRIGFSGYGAGELADVAAPILIELREILRMTALVAFTWNQELHAGLYSVGRGGNFARPVPIFDILERDETAKGQTMILRSRVPDGATGDTRYRFRAATGSAGPSRQCHIGALTQGPWPVNDGVISRAIDQAGARLFSVGGGA